MARGRGHPSCGHSGPSFRPWSRGWVPLPGSFPPQSHFSLCPHGVLQEVRAAGLWEQKGHVASHRRMMENPETSVGPLSRRPLQPPESRPGSRPRTLSPDAALVAKEGNQSHRACKSSSFIRVRGTPDTEAHGLFPRAKRLPGPHGSRSPLVTSSHPQGTVGLGRVCLEAGGPQRRLFGVRPQ